MLQRMNVRGDTVRPISFKICEIWSLQLFISLPIFLSLFPSNLRLEQVSLLTAQIIAEMFLCRKNLQLEFNRLHDASHIIYFQNLFSTDLEKKKKKRIGNKLSRVASFRVLIIQHTPNKWVFGSPKHRWLSKYDCSILAAAWRGVRPTIWQILLPLLKIARHQTRYPLKNFSSRMSRCFRQRRWLLVEKSPITYLCFRKEKEWVARLFSTIIDKF